MGIRLATPADLAAINAIYNHYVLTSTATFQTEPSTEDERRAWFDAHGELHPATVIEADGQVVGWGALNPFKPRQAYRQTVENSVYIRDDARGRGFGRAILGDLIERARALQHHVIVAVIADDQAASLALHEHLGFMHGGRLREVGFKLGRWVDVAYLQRTLETDPRL